MDAAYSPEERAAFLSTTADRVARVDAQMSARLPRAVGDDLFLSRDAALEDLDFFLARVEECHPGYLLSFRAASEWEDLKSRARLWIDRLSPDGQIARTDALLAVYYVAAAIEDGHTGPSAHWYDDLPAPAGTAFPPFVLGFADGKWILAGGLGPLAGRAGAAVAAVDGKSPDEALEAILLAIPAENAAWRRGTFCEAQRFFYGLIDPFAGRDSVAVELEDGSSWSLPLIGQADFDSIPKGLTVAPGTAPGFALAEEGVGVYTYSSFDAGEDAYADMADVFKTANDLGVRDLVIDLRRNGGGNSSAGDQLICHFHEDQYKQFRKVVARYSAPVAELFRGKGWPVSGKPGTWAVYEGGLRKPARAEPFFAGKVHLLVGPGTFSSASDFAAAFKDFAMGEVWGSETGGVRTCHGDRLSFKLPRSGQEVGVSWKTFFGPKPAPAESRTGVLPDHAATAEALAPYAAAADPELAWVVAELRAR